MSLIAAQPMTKFRDSLDAYRSPTVVEYFNQSTSLQDAEAELLRVYFLDGMRVLDLGVGTGRTTSHLAPRASRYVGVDYSDRMIERCRNQYPHFSFLCANAAAMPMFEGGTFDFVLFSFNGLGTLATDSARHACLSECARVLRPGGIFMFSLHNSRFLVPRPQVGGVSWSRKAWRVAYACYQGARNTSRRLLSRAYWEGAGYVTDPLARGGLRVYTATPGLVSSELSAFGFSVVRCVAAPCTIKRSPFQVGWYYYACRLGG